MIHVDKDFQQPPPPLQLTFKSKKKKALAQHIRNLLDSQNGKTALARVYRGAKAALLDLYHRKCAYCESDLQHVTSALVVEHYRPKDGIHGEPRAKGYYWLAYEWSNLVLACFDCNGEKSNRFPIRGKRVTTPPVSKRFRWLADGKVLMSEGPALFHPEVDRPEDSFRFTPEGDMSGVDGEGRGQETIDICQLYRPGLIFNRRKCLSTFVNRFRDLLNALIETQKIAPLSKQKYLKFLEAFQPIFLDLERNAGPKYEYSLMMRQSLMRFDEFYLKSLLGEPWKILNQAYQRYLMRVAVEKAEGLR